MRAIITGAASGIGKAVALRFAHDAQKSGRAGAQLLLVDLVEDKLNAAAAEIRACGAQVETFAGDLTDVSIPARAVAVADSAFGGLDALISNAGMIKRASLLELTLEDYEQAFAINTRATWLLAKAAHPLLKASKGCIVATASISAHQPTPPLGAYSASKAALVMLVQQMACDWAPDGIRCNTVSPGSTHTGMTDARYSDAVQREAAIQKNPLRMLGQPEHQAAVIAFLAGPEAAYVTGIDVVVDGGMSTMLMQAMALGDPWKR